MCSTVTILVKPVTTCRACLLFLVLVLAACQPAQASNNPDNALTISNKGSDTIVNLALAWAEAYQTVRPDVRISVTGGGSGTGIAAMINGTVDIANASRQMKPEEIDQAKAHGINPVEHVIARDAIAVIVNPANPVEHLTLQQISDMYSGKLTDWSQVGGNPGPIVLLSRETNSGTHVYFLEAVVRLGRPNDKTLFSPDTLLLPSSEGITVETRQNPYAIGYDGLGYVTPEVKVLAVGVTPEGPFVLPSADTVNRTQDRYPISRDLYMYTAGEPQGAVKAYLDWILGDQAQAIVTRLGFVPAR
jgi:phosphate transport system substrate-binding protein